MKNRSLIYNTKQKDWIAGNASPTSGYSWAQKIKNSACTIGDHYLALSNEHLWRLVPDPTFPSVRYAHVSDGLFHDGASSDYSAQQAPWDVSHMYQARAWNGTTYYPSDANAVKTWIWAAQDADKNRNVFYLANAGALYGGNGVDNTQGYVPGSRYFYIGQYAYGLYHQLFRMGGGFDKIQGGIDEGEIGDLLTTAWAYALTGSGNYAKAVGIMLARYAYFMDEPGSHGDMYGALGLGNKTGGYSIDEWFSSAVTGGANGKFAAAIGNALDSNINNNYSSSSITKPNGTTTVGWRLGNLYDAEVSAQLTLAYELVYDGLDNQNLLSFLDQKATTYSGLSKMRTNDTGNYDVNILRRLIEDKVITPMLEQVYERRVFGNFGKSQRFTIDGAIVLDDNNYENLLIDGNPRTGYTNGTSRWYRDTSINLTYASPGLLGSGHNYSDAVTFSQIINDNTAIAAEQNIGTTALATCYPRSDGFNGQNITLVSGAIYYFGGWMRSFPLGTNRTSTVFAGGTEAAAGAATAVRAGLWVADSTGVLENGNSVGPSDAGPITNNPRTTITLTGTNWTYFRCAALWPYDSPPPTAHSLRAQIRNSDGTDNYNTGANPNIGFVLWHPRVWQSGVGSDDIHAHYSFQVVNTGTLSEIRFPRTKQWIEQFLFKPGNKKSVAPGVPTSGWFPYLMNNFSLGDGMPAAQGDYQDKDLMFLSNVYRSLWKNPIYSGSPTYDPYNNEKFRLGSYAAGWRTLLSGANLGLHSHIGDGGAAGRPDSDAVGHFFVRKEWYMEMFGDTYDPKYAQLAHMLNSGIAGGLHYGLWHPNPMKGAADVTAIIATSGTQPLPRLEVMPFTNGKIRNQSGDACVWFWWGAMPGWDGTAGQNYNPDGERWGDAHSHRDCLTWGIMASGYDLSPDLGYPADFNELQYNWNNQTLSHNCVLVGTGTVSQGWVDWPNRSTMLIFGQDDDAPNMQGGKLDTSFEAQRVRYIEATALHAYDGWPLNPAPQYLASGVVKEYRRALAMVDISEDASGSQFYVLDIFKAVGGTHHLYSFHGPLCSTSTAQTATNIATSGLGTLTATLVGTMAGESYGYQTNFLPDPRWAAAGSKDPGFTFINHCKKAYSPVSGFYLQWNNVDFWNQFPGKNVNASLRMWPINGYSDITLGQGFPNSINNGAGPSSNYEVDYFIGHTTGNSPLASTFISAFDVCGRGTGINLPNAHISGVDEFRLQDETDNNGALARACRVMRYNAREDWFGTSINHNTLRQTKDGWFKWRGRFAAVGIVSGVVDWSVLHGGSYLEWGGVVIYNGASNTYSGVITSFDTRNDHQTYREIITAAPVRGELVGQVIKVNSSTNDTQNSSFKIEAIEFANPGSRIIVKNNTFVFGQKHKYDYAQGLLYNFAVGDTFEIMGPQLSALSTLGVQQGLSNVTPLMDGIGMQAVLSLADGLASLDGFSLAGGVNSTINLIELFDIIGFHDDEGVNKRATFSLGDSATSISAINSATDLVASRITNLDTFNIGEIFDIRLSSPSSTLVSGISVRTALETPGINISYISPDSTTWEEVLTTRKTRSYPTAYNDGLIVHSGLRSVYGSAAQVQIEDHYQMRHNTIYYYTFFTHSSDYHTGLVANSAVVYSGASYPANWTALPIGLGTIIEAGNIVTPVPDGATLKFTASGTIVASGFPFLKQTVTGVVPGDAYGVELAYKNPTLKDLIYTLNMSGLYWDAKVDKWYNREVYNPTGRSKLATRIFSSMTGLSGALTSAPYEIMLRTSGLHLAGDGHYIYHVQIYTGSQVNGNDWVVTSGKYMLVDASLNNPDSFKFDQYRTIGKAYSGNV